MANDYFNASTTLTKHTLARSAQVNAIFQSVAAGLDKLPGADPLNQGRVTYVADTGAADAYVVALAKAPSSYVAGLSIVMKATNTNTGASTVNVNSLGVKTIKRYNGDDTVANDIVSGALIHLVYDGTNFRIVGANGAESALAKEWATSTSVVSGGLKGARGYAQDAATSEANAGSHFNTFQGIFYGALATDPATDPNGDPPGAGDWYFNTTSSVGRQFDGAAWNDLPANLTTDNSILAKVGSAVAGGLAVPQNSLVGRFGSSLATLAVSASRIVGRGASGALKAMTSSEVFSFLGITATAAELNLLDGYTGTTADMNSVLTPYAAQRVELGGDFSAGEEVVCERIGNTVTITLDGALSHTSTGLADSSSGAIPASFRPSAEVSTVYKPAFSQFADLTLTSTGILRVEYLDEALAGVARTDTGEAATIQFVIADNIT